MATTMELPSFMPTIKCSNCGNNVEISAMGDHVCKPDALSIPSIPTPPPSAGLESPGYLTTAMASKPGRAGVPPQIDPSIANRAFLHPNMPTPASSIGSHSPVSVTSVPPRSPLRPPPPPRSQSSDDEESEVINLDSVFTSFPIPERSPARLNDGATPRSIPPAPSPGLGLGLVPENIQLPPSPLPPHPDPSDSGHQRGDSIASHSSYRTSFASTRYASSAGRSSTYSFSRGLRTFMDDDKPPLPPAPLRTSNKSPVIRDSDVSLSSSYRSDYQTDRGESYSGFDFGISSGRPSTQGLHDLPEELSPDERTGYMHDQNSQLPSPMHLHPDPNNDAPRKDSDATSDSALSVTNFARALGLDDHYTQTESSNTSDDSSPSDTRSGSSMSSVPSESSSHRHKPTDPLNLGPLVEELPPRTRQTILELPGRTKGALDEVPPIPAVFFSPDSPTDPAIGQGSLALVSDRPARTKTPVQAPPSPLRPPQRSATTPIPPSTSPIARPPTRSATRSKGKCKGCNEEITGKSISSSDGRLTGRYHRGCFVCFECHSPFQTADFYVLNNRPYCAQHYHERNGSLCSTCHTGIEGQYLETIELSQGRSDRRRFHPECLQCRTCRVMLNGDYFEWNGQVYCERDAQRAAAAYYPPPPGRRRPTAGSSPLSQSREFPPRSPGPPGPPGPPAGLRPPPSPAPGQGLRPGPRFPSGGARRFPERRTTRLMMI
ncbi:hypothetical protein N7474_009206 [Penicillium riverlandense]|uniref:uncharacterized protein n=1 Tax=Penicillium riverlandense TaxID=1903569 RepID=UPI002546A0D9|nr:uncharacterized protein N7474_009206 [Penicillium riverlandense]KAJ5807937.1 hypothetical protein N7474_009206 [Penicillium riverlandense]